MAINKRVYAAVKSGRSYNNIRFNDFAKLIIDLGFVLRRQRGSHRIYKHPTLNESMNIQPDDNMAKAYQVEQLREIIIRYNL